MRIVIPWLAALAFSQATQRSGTEVGVKFDLDGGDPVELAPKVQRTTFEFFIILKNEASDVQGNLICAAASEPLACAKVLSGEGVALWRAEVRARAADRKHRIAVALEEVSGGRPIAGGSFFLLLGETENSG